MTPASSDPFEALTEESVARGAVLGQMISSPGLKLEGRFLCFRLDGALAVKLPPERAEELVATGMERFDRGDGRPMRQWILLPDDDAGRWAALLDEAWSYRQADGYA